MVRNTEPTSTVDIAADVSTLAPCQMPGLYEGRYHRRETRAPVRHPMALCLPVAPQHARPMPVSIQSGHCTALPQCVHPPSPICLWWHICPWCTCHGKVRRKHPQPCPLAAPHPSMVHLSQRSMAQPPQPCPLAVPRPSMEHLSWQGASQPTPAFSPCSGTSATAALHDIHG